MYVLINSSNIILRCQDRQIPWTHGTTRKVLGNQTSYMSRWSTTKFSMELYNMSQFYETQNISTNYSHKNTKKITLDITGASHPRDYYLPPHPPPPRTPHDVAWWGGSRGGMTEVRGGWHTYPLAKRGHSGFPHSLPDHH